MTLIAEACEVWSIPLTVRGEVIGSAYVRKNLLGTTQLEMVDYKVWKK
jgi:hypothetical protein